MCVKWRLQYMQIVSDPVMSGLSKIHDQWNESQKAKSPEGASFVVFVDQSALAWTILFRDWSLL
jgi:hypothetical protein